MTEPTDAATWRNRFIAIQLVRLGATAFALFALLLWQTDLVVQGGTILGFPLALLGVVTSFMAPQWLARRWRTPPEA